MDSRANDGPPVSDTGGPDELCERGIRPQRAPKPTLRAVGAPIST